MSDLDPRAIQERAAQLELLQMFFRGEPADLRDLQTAVGALLDDRAEREQELAELRDSRTRIADGYNELHARAAAAEADREAAREALARLRDCVSRTEAISDEAYEAWRDAGAVLARISSANQEEK